MLPLPPQSIPERVIRQIEQAAIKAVLEALRPVIPQLKGRDAPTMPEIIEEAVPLVVEAAVPRIPIPRDGRDGPTVEQVVAAIVPFIPPPAEPLPPLPPPTLEEIAALIPKPKEPPSLRSIIESVKPLLPPGRKGERGLKGEAATLSLQRDGKDKGPVKTLDIRGQGVALRVEKQEARLTFERQAMGGSGIDIRDEGTNVGRTKILDFKGVGVSTLQKGIVTEVTIPGGGGGGTPADTVVTETSFGQASAVGVGSDYAREDHTHGTPAEPSVPAASGTVASETSFGIASAAGAAGTFSRGDHTHGSPTDPVPAHAALADVHHAKVHTHVSAAEGGTVSHDDLTGVSIDDHHARDHSIIGATHSGFPGGGTTFLRDDATFAAPPGGGVTFGPPTGAIDLGDANNEGVSANATRTDHQHSFPVPGAGYPSDTDFSAEADGTATTPARSDHRHNIPAPAAPAASAVGDTVVTGTATSPARADHRHAREAFGGAGYPVDASFAAEADGIAATLARSDHRHALTAPATGYPVDVADTEADGTGAEPARSDHRHAHGTGYLPDAHHAQAHNDAHSSGGADAFAVTDLLDAIARTTVRKNTGADVGSRRRLNLIEGSNVTLTVADDAAGEEVDVTIAAAAGGAGADPPEGSYAPGSYTIATGKFRVAAARQQFTGAQQLIIQGTGRLSIHN